MQFKTETMRRILLALALAGNVFGTNSYTVDAFVIHPHVYCPCSWKKQDTDSTQLPHKAVKQPNNEVSGRPQSPFQKQQRNTTRSEYEKEERASYIRDFLDDIRDGIRSVLEEMKLGDIDFSVIDDSTSYDSGGGVSGNFDNDWSNIGRGSFGGGDTSTTTDSCTTSHRGLSSSKSVECGTTKEDHGGGWDFGSMFGGSVAHTTDCSKSHESSTGSDHGSFSFGSIFGDSDATCSSTSSHSTSDHGFFGFGGSDLGGSTTDTSFSSDSSSSGGFDLGSFGGFDSGSFSFGSDSFSGGGFDSGGYDSGSSYDSGGYDSSD
jgi:hypothetical protein